MSFNLSIYKAKMYVLGMGSTHVKNRESYDWWTMEELMANPNDERFMHFVKEDPSLKTIIDDANCEHYRKVRMINNQYGVPNEMASKLEKTFIGYHPSYGGYICHVGPYVYDPRPGQEQRIQTEAIGNFYYYITRKRKSTNKEIEDSVKAALAHYQEKFGVELDSADLKLVLKSSPDQFDPNRIRQKKKVLGEIASLDKNEPPLREFVQRSPMVGEGSHVMMNNKGYEKLINNSMGPEYQQYLQEKAIKERKTPEQLRQEVLSCDFKQLKKIYNEIRKSWVRNRKVLIDVSGNPIKPPPTFLDKSLKLQSGMDTKPTSIDKFNKHMVEELALKLEVAHLMAGGIVDPQKIANTLNEAKSRKVYNIKRIKDGKQPILITPEEAQIQMQFVEEIKSEKNLLDYKDVVKEIAFITQEMRNKRGYGDLKTALRLTKIHFSNLPRDIKTKSPLAIDYQNLKKEDVSTEESDEEEIESVVFDPPEDFVNFTTEQIMKLKPQGALIDQMATNPEKAKELQEEEEMGEAAEEKTEEKELSEMEKQEVQQPISTGIIDTQVKTPSTEENFPIVDMTEPVPTPTQPILTQPSLDWIEEMENNKTLDVPVVNKKKRSPVKNQINKTKPKKNIKTPEKKIDKVVSNTIVNLIKIAKTLDEEGKCDAAEEVHMIIRKYQERIL